jgi:hypothetical protein
VPGGSLSGPDLWRGGLVINKAGPRGASGVAGPCARLVLSSRKAPSRPASPPPLSPHWPTHTTMSLGEIRALLGSVPLDLAIGKQGSLLSKAWSFEMPRCCEEVTGLSGDRWARATCARPTPSPSYVCEQGQGTGGSLQRDG